MAAEYPSRRPAGAAASRNGPAHAHAPPQPHQLSAATRKRHASDFLDDGYAAADDMDSVSSQKRPRTLDPQRPHGDEEPSTSSTSAAATSGGEYAARSQMQQHRRQLAKYLAILEKDQLVSIVMKLAEAADDRVLQLMSDVVPRPTIESVSKHFESLERKLLSTFPYSRTGPVLNDYSYRRVQPVLDDIHGAMVEFLDYFFHAAPDPAAVAHDAAAAALDQLNTLLAFLRVASTLAGRLPDWESPENNHAKLDLVHRLRSAWRSAVAQAAAWPDTHRRVLARSEVEHWFSLLDDANTATRGALADAAHDFVQLLGWHLGIAPPPQQQHGFASFAGGAAGTCSSMASALNAPPTATAWTAGGGGSGFHPAAPLPPASALFGGGGAGTAPVFGVLGSASMLAHPHHHHHGAPAAAAPPNPATTRVVFGMGGQ
ncbi:Tethering factor for nuclear proteasome sts1 [Blastocladiella emersonii ATCC 22665]|nr:Tethering factor for nuclear proteasome sts1 [Blastocladiella emersonii ATCC 22665]